MLRAKPDSLSYSFNGYFCFSTDIIFSFLPLSRSSTKLRLSVFKYSILIQNRWFSAIKSFSIFLSNLGVLLFLVPLAEQALPRLSSNIQLLLSNIYVPTLLLYFFSFAPVLVLYLNIFRLFSNIPHGILTYLL